MKINCIIKSSPLWKQSIEWNDATQLQREDANLRTMKNNEIVLDCDQHGEKQSSFSEVVAKLTEDNMKFTAYQHRKGEDSGHVHCYFDRDITNEERAIFIDHYGCDPAKASKSTFISMEDKPHFKTGEKKTLKADFRGINTVPGWLTEELKKTPKKEPISVKDVSQGSAEGNRNENAFKLATFHRKGGAKLEETMILIQDMNRRNNPPLTDNEIETIVKSAYRGEKPYGTYFKENPKTGDEEIDSDRFFNISKNKDGKITTKRFISKKLGDEIQKENSFKTMIGNEKIYVYKDDYYKPEGCGHIKNKCKNKLGDEFTKNRASEVISYIQAGTYTDPKEIDNGYINLDNGLLEPNTMEFVEHTPDIFTVRKVPITYDPEADCPLFKEKLSEKIDVKTMNVIQEMFGYCFMPGQQFEVAFLLYGPHRTMKSTVLHILEKMMGEGNVRSFSLQYLTEKDFATAYLYGIPINICADLSAKQLKNTGTFMTWTAGDSQTAAKKGEHPITWTPSTKLIFSCNQIPGTPNKNLAYYRRWITLNFPNQTSKEEIDSDMKEKLLEELPGILNWSLKGMERLKKNKKTSFWLDEHGVKDLYERNADTISSFIYNGVDTEDDTGKLQKRIIYRAYVEYCKSLGLTPENQMKFGRVFKEVTGCGTSRINDIPAYTGVSLQNGEELQRRLDV